MSSILDSYIDLNLNFTEINKEVDNEVEESNKSSGGGFHNYAKVRVLMVYSCYVDGKFYHSVANPVNKEGEKNDNFIKDAKAELTKLLDGKKAKVGLNFRVEVDHTSYSHRDGVDKIISSEKWDKDNNFQFYTDYPAYYQKFTPKNGVEWIEGGDVKKGDDWRWGQQVDTLNLLLPLKDGKRDYSVLGVGWFWAKTTKGLDAYRVISKRPIINKETGEPLQRTDKDQNPIFKDNKPVYLYNNVWCVIDIFANEEAAKLWYEEYQAAQSNGNGASGEDNFMDVYHGLSSTLKEEYGEDPQGIKGIVPLVIEEMKKLLEKKTPLMKALKEVQGNHGTVSKADYEAFKAYHEKSSAF